MSDRDVDLSDEYAERAYASWYPRELKTDGAGRRRAPGRTPRRRLRVADRARRTRSAARARCSGRCSRCWRWRSCWPRRWRGGWCPEPWATRRRGARRALATGTRRLDDDHARRPRRRAARRRRAVRAGDARAAAAALRGRRRAAARRAAVAGLDVRGRRASSSPGRWSTGRCASGGAWPRWWPPRRWRLAGLLRDDQRPLLRRASRRARRDRRAAGARRSATSSGCRGSPACGWTATSACCAGRRCSALVVLRRLAALPLPPRPARARRLRRGARPRPCAGPAARGGRRAAGRRRAARRAGPPARRGFPGVPLVAALPALWPALMRAGGCRHAPAPRLAAWSRALGVARSTLGAGTCAPGVHLDAWALGVRRCTAAWAVARGGRRADAAWGAARRRTSAAKDIFSAGAMRRRFGRDRLRLAACPECARRHGPVGVGARECVTTPRSTRPSARRAPGAIGRRTRRAGRTVKRPTASKTRAATLRPASNSAAMFLTPDPATHDELRQAVAGTVEALIKAASLARAALADHARPSSPTRSRSSTRSPRTARRSTQVLDDLAPVLEGGIRLGDPNCVAHLHPAPLIEAAAAELAVGVTNQSMDAFDASPAATFVEDALVTRLARAARARRAGRA